jgi:hypothetical protein
MNRLASLILVAALGSACRFSVNSTSSSNANPLAPTPTAPTSPANPTAPSLNGFRTPDPPAGGQLPFPAYGATVAASVSTADVESSCTTTTYLDAVVDALRGRDTRWGYVCSHGNCATVSRDTVGYHATAGPEVTGASGLYVVDIIQNLCASPVAQWLPLSTTTLDPTATWTGKGRF